MGIYFTESKSIDSDNIEILDEANITVEKFFAGLQKATYALKTEEIKEAEIVKRLNKAKTALKNSKELLDEYYQSKKKMNSVKLKQYVAAKVYTKNLMQSILFAFPAGFLIGAIGGANPIVYPLAFLTGYSIGTAVTEININNYEKSLKKIVEANKEAVKYLEERKRSIKESCCDDIDLSGENYFAYTALSKELDPEKEYDDFFRYPEYTKMITEFFDIKDTLTRKSLIHLNEADQNQVLTSLTSKLYDIIQSKAVEIDYGNIPETKGDITKLPEYDNIVECIITLRGILKEYKQDSSPVEELSMALANLQSRKDLFMKAFKYKIELPMMIYCNVTLSIISGISLMIATCIEFVKTPKQEAFEIVLDKVAYSKSKEHLLFNSLKKFNKVCASEDFDKTMDYVVTNNIKGAVNEIAVSAIAIGIGAAGFILLNIIPFLREMIFFFFYTRSKMSDFFNIQADLLQMNAYNVEATGEVNSEQKDLIVKKQLNIVELFRKAANFFSINFKQAEVKATTEISSSSRKLKINDIADDLPDNISSALF